jgi:putative DeoR family transcriptional regulator (stage III sporulation protein D)
MNSIIFRRVMDETNEILNSKKTIREVAKIYNVSKSTVHKDLHERLYYINQERYKEIQEIFKYHIDIRHIRGGESTKKRYLKLN